MLIPVTIFILNRTRFFQKLQHVVRVEERFKTIFLANIRPLPNHHHVLQSLKNIWHSMLLGLCYFKYKLHQHFFRQAEVQPSRRGVEDQPIAYYISVPEPSEEEKIPVLFCVCGGAA